MFFNFLKKGKSLTDFELTFHNPEQDSVVEIGSIIFMRKKKFDFNKKLAYFDSAWDMEFNLQDWYVGIEQSMFRRLPKWSYVQVIASTKTTITVKPFVPIPPAQEQSFILFSDLYQVGQAVAFNNSKFDLTDILQNLPILYNKFRYHHDIYNELPTRFIATVTEYDRSIGIVRFKVSGIITNKESA